MAYQIEFTKQATKALDDLEQIHRVRIIAAVASLEQFSAKTPQVKKPEKPLYGYRLRVGNFRVLFTAKNALVEIYEIADRKDAY